MSLIGWERTKGRRRLEPKVPGPWLGTKTRNSKAPGPSVYLSFKPLATF